MAPKKSGTTVRAKSAKKPSTKPKSVAEHGKSVKKLLKKARKK